jgi:hypothetical protein
MIPRTRNGSNTHLDEAGPPSGTTALLGHHSDIIHRPGAVRVPRVRREIEEEVPSEWDGWDEAIGVPHAWDSSWAPVPVPVGNRGIEVTVASRREEWEEAYCLVAEKYRCRGYEAAGEGTLRFTAHHALSDTATFIALQGGVVIATLSAVLDNVLLGLPIEAIYGEEVGELRQKGRHLVEVTSLADRGLSVREFLPVFVALIRIMVQWADRRGADTWVITINPRHRAFYRKVMGFVPLGPQRPLPTVGNHPAEAYLLDHPNARANAPDMYRQLLGELLPPEALRSRPLPAQLARHFAARSSQTDVRRVEEILRTLEQFGPVRAWPAREIAPVRADGARSSSSLQPYHRD